MASFVGRPLPAALRHDTMQERTLCAMPLCHMEEEHRAQGALLQQVASCYGARLSASTALSPPNANELLSAARTSIDRATFGT